MSTTMHPPLLSLTPAERRFLQRVAEDTEDAPWMVMNNDQIYNASTLYVSLLTYSAQQRPSWHIGSMLPLYYPATDRHGRPRAKAVAPDLFAARVPLAGRSSLDTTQEGMPPFVLELVSPGSIAHDLSEKTELYRLLGAEEYAIVRLDQAPPRLEGYRRGADGAWEHWEPDAQGRLWSAVLELWLVVIDGVVRAQTASGALVPTLAEEAAARQQAERARVQEATARVQAEAENAELRRLIERLQREQTER